jgi:hypothetical protein
MLIEICWASGEKLMHGIWIEYAYDFFASNAFILMIKLRCILLFKYSYRI